MFSCVLPRPILPAKPMLRSLSWLLRVCPHNWNFLLENLALSNDTRNNCLQEKPRLLSKESEPYSLQLQEAITVEDDGAGSLACAYKWCTCVIIIDMCGEGVGRGQGKNFFFLILWCSWPRLNTWDTDRNQKYLLPLSLWQGMGLAKCSAFHKRKNFPLLDYFWN